MKFKKRKLNLTIKFKIIVVSLTAMLISISTIISLSLYTVNKRMLEQLKSTGMDMITEINSEIEMSRTFENEINNILGDKITNAAYLISNVSNISNEVLKDISKKINISEINVANSEGVVIYSNLNENIGVLYPKEHPAQKILKGETDKVVEDIRKSSSSDNYYKYGAVASKDGGIIQVGILATEIHKILNSVSTQSIVDRVGKKENIIYALTIGKDLKAKTHNMRERIGKDLSDDPGSISAARDEKTYTSTYNFTSNGKDILTYDVLIPTYFNGQHTGALNIGLSMEKGIETFKGVLNISVIIAIFAFLLGGLVLYFIISKLIKPLKDMTTVAYEVSKGDLTKKIQIKSGDEIGLLGESFNAMVSSLRDMTEKTRKISAALLTSSEIVLQSIEQTSAASQEISATTQQLSIGAENQLKTCEDINKNASSVITNMNDMSLELSEVLSSANNTSSLASDGREKINNMVNQIALIKNSVDFSFEVIEELQKTSSQIANIVEIMDGVANQTNLLALNASIEAARAGEAGRGFAVVADEVRKLAEESMESSNNIRTLIENNQKISEKAIKAIRDGNKETQKGEETVKDVETSLIEILRGIDLTKEKLDSVNKKLDGSNKSIEGMSSNIKNITITSEESAAATQQVAASIEEQSASMEEITEAVKNLSEMTGELEESIKIFKL